jgi:hypothetical protein
VVEWAVGRKAMVTITIYLEGGVLPNLNDAAQTTSNSTRLREAFSKLLRQVFLEEDYNLEIKPSGGYISAAKRFKELREDEKETVLLIDLDGPQTEKPKKLEELDLVDYVKEVFFMIQEMEAWILSQPDKIEQFAQKEQFVIKNEEKKVADNNLIKGKNIEDIKKPSGRLHTIFEQHFQVMQQRRGKAPKAKKRGYGKLKDAPSLLELLDLSVLRKSFEDVENLILYIESKK